MIMKQSSKDLLQHAMETTAFEELEMKYTNSQLIGLIAELSNCTSWGEITEVLVKHQDQLIDNF